MGILFLYTVVWAPVTTSDSYESMDLTFQCLSYEIAVGICPDSMLAEGMGPAPFEGASSIRDTHTVSDNIHLWGIGILENSIDKLPDVQHILRLVIVLELMLQVPKAPHGPIELSLCIALREEVLNSHAESIIIPGVPNYLIARPMHEYYGPSFNGGVIIFLASKWSSDVLSSVKAIGFIAFGIIEPAYKVVGQPSFIGWNSRYNCG